MSWARIHYDKHHWIKSRCFEAVQDLTLTKGMTMGIIFMSWPRFNCNYVTKNKI